MQWPIRLRLALLMPFRCRWNAAVRRVTAALELAGRRRRPKARPSCSLPTLAYGQLNRTLGFLAGFDYGLTLGREFGRAPRQALDRVPPELLSEYGRAVKAGRADHPGL